MSEEYSLEEELKSFTVTDDLVSKTATWNSLMGLASYLQVLNQYLSQLGDNLLVELKLYADKLSVHDAENIAKYFMSKIRKKTFAAHYDNVLENLHYKRLLNIPSIIAKAKSEGTDLVKDNIPAMFLDYVITKDIDIDHETEKQDLKQKLYMFAHAVNFVRGLPEKAKELLFFRDEICSGNWEALRRQLDSEFELMRRIQQEEMLTDYDMHEVINFLEHNAKKQESI